MIWILLKQQNTKHLHKYYESNLGKFPEREFVIKTNVDYFVSVNKYNSHFINTD